MDSTQFDTLVKSLAWAGTRRGLVRLVAALPLVGAVGSLLGEEHAHGQGNGAGVGGGGGRRRRRRARHDPGQNKDTRKGKRQGKRSCAKAGQTPKKGKRTGCCKGLSKDATGRCAAAASGPAPAACTGLKPTNTSPTQGLQEAINQAAPGDTLTLCPGTWALRATVVIAKNLTLRGAGASQTILDGGGAVSVLEIAADATVTLRDLTITKGNASGDFFPVGFGGGIRNLGVTVTLAGVTVVGNTAFGDGGGIFNHFGRTVTLTDGSSVTGNTARLNGGGIFNNAGTVMLLSGSRIGGPNPEDGNTAGVDGGGIGNNAGTVTLESGTSVRGNTANRGGGIDNLGGTVTVDVGALVCDNEPHLDQCRGTFTGTGTCPNPITGVCPPA
jgi:hypothetical protein